MEINEQLKTLAQGVATLGDKLGETAGEHVVLQALALALVRTHPEPRRLVEEFRRVWMRHGSPHQSGADGDSCAAGIAEMLGLLEENLQVPLDVRPPRD